MAEYVLVDKEQLESDLTVVADAIREKGGTSEQLAFPNGMKEAVEAIQSGNDNEAYKHLLGVFTGETTEFYNEDIQQLSDRAFSGTEVKIVNLPNLISTKGYFAYNNSVIEEIYAPELLESGRNLIYSCSKLNTLLVPKYTTESFGNFSYCGKLVNLEIESIPETFSFKDCALLSDKSIQNIIDALADRTGKSASTITFHPDVKAKLTDEQKSQITSKNWILA